MKKHLFWMIAVLTLAIGVGYFFYQTIQLQETVKESEETIEELQTAHEVKEMELYYAEQDGDIERETGYNSWMRSVKLADDLYEDSEGRFKKEWGVFLGEVAEQHDIDPLIVYELLRTETGGKFDPTLVGPETRYGHAYGMAQFMKNTAPWIADKAGLDYADDLLYDPIYSIELAIEYLGFLHDRYDDWDHALTAYHRGMYGLEKYIEENGDAASWYAVEIQENAEALEGFAYLNKE
ncbi:transglycosylase SLT domain-containing protein [Alkalihalophilus lindianensis]|uniref:Transglycosylase SLT domain-containing protein n=1 Tax=Alkalihalophilus lindianensis TaxID=1630542 RepID=A0ABU3X5H3_9BACI|nr:transglycosylase SLT domain-containing protein [Alkalihalophilus lindianensis]MDV2683151.1 transglycosylase SLT domain-containing protein [Alkalihalophilus lindianensis]